MKNRIHKTEINQNKNARSEMKWKTECKKNKSRI